MAVKITSDAIVRVIKPVSHQFNLDELNDQVEGWIEPLKIGPIWVMYKEKAKEEGEPLNQVASFFFDVAMYGTVLVVPAQEMPTEWDLMEDKDYEYSSGQVDSGFLSSLQQALVYNRVFNKDDNFKGFTKEEWSYEPSDEINEEVKDFFRKAYDSIVSTHLTKDNTVLFEDDDVIIKTPSNEDRIKTIQQMIDYFVEEEEYEKCGKLLKLKEDLQ